MEYIVSGHSGHTEQTFQVPYNITIAFYAKPGETCYVPGDKESLDHVLRSIRSETDHIYKTGDTVPNYEVDFRSNAAYEGVASVDSTEHYAFLPNILNTMTLQEICKKIQRNNGRVKTTIYCFFCRGSKREFADMDFGAFDDTKFGDSFSPLDFDFESPIMEPIPPKKASPKKHKSNHKSKKAVKKGKKSPPNKGKKSSKDGTKKNK
jgi:hypothetical protein